MSQSKVNEIRAIVRHNVIVHYYIIYETKTQQRLTNVLFQCLHLIPKKKNLKENKALTASISCSVECSKTLIIFR